MPTCDCPHDVCPLFSWQQPDLDRVVRALEAGGLEWQRATIRRKLAPLLMEWDANHPGPSAEFVALAIVKVSPHLPSARP